MKISLNWLKDYIHTDLSTDKICELLTAIGLEVEGVEAFESIKGGLKDLVVGEVKTCEKHENADKLSVCSVDVGGEAPLQIVCGAPNVAAGQKVIVAPVGSTIFPSEGEPFNIGKAKIRGVQSFGMICAEDEIGLGASHDGILVLPEATPVGQPVKELYDIYSDTIIEIGLTPNRSDAQSHIGVARDLAAAIKIQEKQAIQVQWPSVDAFEVANTNHHIEVSVENLKACPRYAGVVISGLEIKPSPTWLQNKLKAIGVRPISNVVDITNFINHELGQPLHAFDLEKITGKQIMVQNLPQGTKFTTLDEVERSLSDEDLMICNAEEGMCIGGVFGGLKSGVTDSTTAIFLESAYFDPRTIRRTELRHDLRTDAAVKFEKGIDPELQVYALKRAALMMQELAGGEITSEVVDIYPTPIERAIVTLSYKRLNTLTGIDMAPELTKEILSLLDFDIKSETETGLELFVPQYRNDVTREADVIEEVLRIYGLDNVPISGKVNFEIGYGLNTSDELRNLLSDQLSAQGFYEIITNSITRSKYYNNLEDSSVVKPLNSLNAHLDILRPAMLMTGLESIAHNQNRNMIDCKFYDFGKTYSVKADGAFQENMHVALYTSGNQQAESWTNFSQPADFYELKAFVEQLFAKSGLGKTKVKTEVGDQFEYGIAYQVKGQTIAEVGKVAKTFLQQAGIKKSVYYADIDFQVLLNAYEANQQKFKAIPKYPSMRRDLALVVNKEVEYASIKKIASVKTGPQLRSMNLFDVFESEEKLGAGKKSYAVSFTFRDDKATLTDEVVDAEMKKLIKGFQEELSAEVRS
ncbi:MAG: phenylalanine--tRNA ligase subunit beta [Saprospiraceae bacterium]|nr:phenylalanine--tRNA ligase subunit beta [Saprospiraceae bacterium]